MKRLVGGGARLWLGLGLLFAVGSAASARSDDTAPQRAETPSEVVERFHAELLAVMRQAEALGYEGRYQRLAPVIEQVFDLPFAARKSAGRHWKSLGEQERARLVDTLSRLSVATYASRFDGYSGERFETLGEDPSAHGTILVRTRLIRTDEEPVSLAYRLRPEGQSWKIIDVLLDGSISELALRRSQYSSVIRRKGFDALIEQLEAKIVTYAHERSSS